MCIEANYELLALTGVNTASRHRDPTPAVLQIKIHIDFIWTVNTFEERKEPGGLSFPSQLVVTSDQLCDWHIHYTAYVATANL